MIRLQAIGLAVFLAWASARADDVPTRITSAHPGQMKIVDVEGWKVNSWYRRWLFPKDQPEDWTYPVDYEHGTTYLRLEVVRFGKKREDGSTQVMLQPCYFQDRHVASKHCCKSGINFVFTEPGVYYRKFENAELSNEGGIDWSRKLLSFMLIDNSSSRGSKLSAEIRATVIVVGKGHRFRPPEGWHCPSDWACIAPGRYGGLHYKDLKHLDKAASSLAKGRLGAAYEAAGRELDSDEPQRAEEARRVTASLERYLTESREHWTRIKSESPAIAVEGLSALAREFSASKKGKELSREAREWAKDPIVRNERAACFLLDRVRKAAGTLRRKMGDRRASEPEVAKRYAREITVIARQVIGIRNRYPDTPSGRRAVKLARSLGIPLLD